MPIIFNVCRPPRRNTCTVLAHELQGVPCVRQLVERRLNAAGIPATVQPNGELSVVHGRIDAAVCAEATRYTWLPEEVPA